MNKFLGIVLISLASFSLFGQSGNSPLSRFGIGDLVDENFVHARGMGGLGASTKGRYHINIVNPASIASLRTTSFDIGLDAKYTSLTDLDGQSISQWGGNLKYISLAFPLSNPLNEILDREERDYNLGMAFTLMPHSIVSYDISSVDSLSGIGQFRRNFNGNGGSYKFYWSNAISYKQLSFGVNLGYLFGNIAYERNIAFDDVPFPYQTLYSEDYSLKGFLWNAGLQYDLILNKKALAEKKNVSVKKITFGLRGHSNTGFSTSSDVVERVVQFLATGATDSDTLNFDLDRSGEGTLPASFAIGATYQNGQKFAFGVNYSATAWNNYFNENNPEDLNNTYKLSVGGFIRPNYRSYSNFLKRASYRFGGFINTDPRKIEGEDLQSYGVTFGIGLPFIYQRKISHANLGLELGSRGSGSPLAETYARFLLSFTFNDDEWFIKRKYD